MKRLRIKRIGILFIFATFLVAFAIGLALPHNFSFAYAMNEQETELVENSALKSTYEMYEDFKAPEGELVVGSEVQKAESCEVTLPTGNVVNGFEGFLISEYGKFAVKYSKVVDGTKYYAVKDFSVYKDAYRLDTVRSTCNYVDQIEKSDEEISGLHLKLELNRGFYYEKPIPVSSLTGRGDFITFYPYVDDYYKKYNQLVGVVSKEGKPTEGATTAATRPFEISFKLTDSEDSDNYVVVTYSLFHSSSRLEGTAYALYHRAYASRQAARGWNQSDTASDTATTKAVIHNGVKYSVFTNGNYGTTGLYHGPTKNRPCTYGFNATTMEVKVSENSSKNKAESLVNVLNNYNIYGENLFEGFKGDNVYLSIMVSGYCAVLSPYMEFDITQIGPYTGFDLQSNKVVDKTGPKIKVDFDSDSFNVAKDAKFYPPAFSVSDASAIAKKGVRVYRLAGNQKSYVGGTIEEYFVPNELGEYYLEYYAQDLFGNESTKTIKLISKFNNGKGIVFSSSRIVGAKFGEKVTLPSYTVSSLNNGKVDVSVKSPKGYIELGQDNTFIPNCVGTYTINYHYYDEIYNYNLSYEFEVEKSNNYLIYEEPRYNTEYLNNKYYALDKVYATFVNNTEEVKEAVTYAFEDGVTELAQAQKVENGKDYFCTAKEKVQFKVVYNDGVSDLILYESEEIPVVAVYEQGNFKLENYFLVENCAITVDNSKTTFNVDTDKSTSKIDFIGNVLLSNFSIAFQIPKGKAGFKTLTIRVSDYYDSANYFDVKYNVYGGYYTCQINNSFVRSYVYEFTNYLYEIGYVNGVISIYNQEKINYNYEPNFIKDKARVSVIIEGVSSASELEIHSINNTQMSLNTNDVNAKPALGDLRLPSYVNKGDKIIIPFEDVSDVLNPTINERMELTITAPDKTNLLNKFVMTEDYGLVFDRFGLYKISLTISSQSVAYDEYTFYVECKNLTAPAISLVEQAEGGEVIYTTNGNEVNVADYVSDENSTVTIYCKDTRGNITRVNDGKIFLDDIGSYTIFYYALGNDGALNIISYTIRVVGETR